MALKITIAYIIIGCTWVLVGDTILEFLMGKREFSSEQVFIYNTVKGLLYILITGLALYFFTNQAIRTTSGLEKQYRTLFEDNPNPMWVYDVATFKILAANKAALEIYGYEKDEFLSLTLENLRLPEDIPVLKEHIKKVQAGHINSGVFRHKKKNGELLYVNISSNSTIFDKHKARLIMALDVTDKKLAEEKNIILNKSLIKYQERLADVLNNITDGFVTLDKELRFTFMNKMSKAITGVEKDEYLGKNIFEVYPQLTKTLFSEKIHEALGGNSVSFEEQLIGGGRWFHFSIYPNPEGVAIYVSDTTETHKMQEEVKRTQTNLNALINNTPDFIWSVDTEFRVQTINAPYRMFIKSFLGTDIQEGDLLIMDDFGPEMREKWLDQYKRGLSGKYFVVDDEFDMPSMGKIYFETSFNPIRNADGEVIGLGCFSRDITLQKMTEMRLAEQNKKLLDIAWMQSHEIRGPLSVIMGLSSLFNHENPADPENGKVLDLLEKAAKNLDEVVAKIVETSHAAQQEGLTNANNNLG